MSFSTFGRDVVNTGSVQDEMAQWFDDSHKGLSGTLPKVDGKLRSLSFIGEAISGTLSKDIHSLVALNIVAYSLQPDRASIISGTLPAAVQTSPIIATMVSFSSRLSGSIADFSKTKALNRLIAYLSSQRDRTFSPGFEGRLDGISPANSPVLKDILLDYHAVSGTLPDNIFGLPLLTTLTVRLRLQFVER